MVSGCEVGELSNNTVLINRSGGLPLGVSSGSILCGSLKGKKDGEAVGSNHTSAFKK